MNQVSAMKVSRWMPAVLLSAFILHNVEEALTYAIYRDQSQALIQRLFFNAFVAPPVALFHVALLLVSLAAIFAMGWTTLHRDAVFALILLKGLAWVMLLNVLVPHIPAAFLLGGYAPGVVSAVALNFPIAGYILFRTRRRKIVG